MKEAVELIQNEVTGPTANREGRGRNDDEPVRMIENEAAELTGERNRRAGREQ